MAILNMTRIRENCVEKQGIHLVKLLYALYNIASYLVIQCEGGQGLYTEKTPKVLYSFAYLLEKKWSTQIPTLFNTNIIWINLKGSKCQFGLLLTRCRHPYESCHLTIHREKTESGELPQ